MFNPGSPAVTHNDNDIWGNGKGCESQTRRVCSTLYLHICGGTSQKAPHTDAASRPYTDQSGILHENAMEKELSAELKKTKESAKNM